MRGLKWLGFLFCFLIFYEEGWSSSEKELLTWQNWSSDVFERAKKQEKFILLDLEAVWCHWCHVMDQITYQDAQVVKLIQSKYIPIRVDQDAYPDLSLRYEAWGWPATIIFSADGTEIVKRKGYIEPENMVKLLKAVMDNPTPIPLVLPVLEEQPSQTPFLTDEQRKFLIDEHHKLYDTEHGGWGFRHKLMDNNHLEYAMLLARQGDQKEVKMARRTLNQALNLLDQEWGGFYQYSDQRDWKSPHYEKIMLIQAWYMRLYAMAYALWQDSRYLLTAKKTYAYVAEFWMNPQGAFYTSQDADVDENFNGHRFYTLNDKARRALRKKPKIDRHIYARENGWMIASLCLLHDVTGDKKYLDCAIQASHWVLKHRFLEEGGFRHDDRDVRGPYLGDSLAMGQAFLNLYTSTGKREWLVKSCEAADFIFKKFQDKKGRGFFTSIASSQEGGIFLEPVKQIEENVSIARWVNLLFHDTGKNNYRQMAEHAMKYLCSAQILQNNKFLAGILLADQELKQDPFHVTVVGSKKSSSARVLFNAALRHPFFYRRIEWRDSQEGPLPYQDIEYPELSQPAAFLCAHKACSLPLFSRKELIKALQKLKKY